MKEIFVSTPDLSGVEFSNSMYAKFHVCLASHPQPQEQEDKKERKKEINK